VKAVGALAAGWGKQKGPRAAEAECRCEYDSILLCARRRPPSSAEPV